MHGVVTAVWGWVLGHPLFGAAMAAAVALALWKRPRLIMKLVLAVLALVAVGYVVSGIADFTLSSLGSKAQMIHKNQ